MTIHNIHAISLLHVLLPLITNDQVIIRFFPRCADGSLNQMNPPCGASVGHSEWTRRNRRRLSSTMTSTSTSTAGATATATSAKSNEDHRRRNKEGSDVSEQYIAGVRTRPPTLSPTPARAHLPAPIFTAVVTQVDSQIEPLIDMHLTLMSYTFLPVIPSFHPRN